MAKSFHPCPVLYPVESRQAGGDSRESRERPNNLPLEGGREGGPKRLGRPLSSGRRHR
ncbi:uncharacterized protein BDZ83DRAFT_599979 [Colletotrichum acutatum]|uniref:Uncharacterized protein n=1 Tax=Glomerella acutata TaxID=27357 RepID=A0AAD9D2X7_GLOAC|nr:uncharacterized protein BDZ83DRAFT_599979 [Colletotrichum acutatum]KAK1731110.1 hypothetical protein BDZ83DRAFT_599979 [Colletotrichum acutatum]